MIIKHCNFEPFLIDSRCFRKGLLVHLSTHDGRTAVAEVSPLPGFSLETLGEALEQLKHVKEKLLTTWWTEQTISLLSALHLYPSVYFALDSALRDLLDPIAEPIECQKYALLFGNPEEVSLLAREISSERIEHAKIKMGHFTPEIAHQVIKQLDDQFTLRIDLNRKWTLQESMDFCKHYPDDYFYYIEEPCRQTKDLIQFKYPFALDETLRDCNLQADYMQSKFLKALIVKPTMIYPVSPFLNLGPELILTSSFESSIGIGQIKRLIHRLGLTDTRHGLDTLRYFENADDLLPVSTLDKAHT